MRAGVRAAKREKEEPSTKVLLVNGSPHQKGCTYTALAEAASALNQEGIETDFFWIGNKLIAGCIGCYQCDKKHGCVFDDKVNEFTKLAVEYDGFIFGSPVYYSGMNGSLMSFMDRVFFSASSQESHPFRFKPAAAVVSARRAGTTSALDQMNKYFLHQQMPIVSSRYWNMVHGNT
ncbi:MAG: flavodoxin family protein, partial [Clostridia bacterium]|nr:flavodoxin family protein [Clostridia bacterium]